MALPSGYTQLEYIQSSGTQYIDTGFKPNQNTSIICDFQIVSTSGWNTVFGSWRLSSNTYVQAFAFLVNSDGQFRDSYGSTHTLLPTSLARNERYVVNKQKNVCTVGGETVTATASTFSCSYNLYLFSGNTGGSASEQSAAKIYSCKIYNNGTLVRDFIPCKNASGTVGLWDDVNSKFYANAGNGTFTAGPEVETNPMAPYDGHNTNIGSMAREIEGGKALIGGVLREFESGLALVGGVSREIEFDLGAVVLTVANKDNYYNKYNANYAYAMVSDARLNPNEMSSMEVPYGTIVTIKLKATNSSNPAKVIVNGTTTFQNSDTRSYTTHEYVAKRNAKITYSTQIIYIDEE